MGRVRKSWRGTANKTREFVDKFAADPIIDISATTDPILLNVRLFVANV